MTYDEYTARKGREMADTTTTPELVVHTDCDGTEVVAYYNEHLRQYVTVPMGDEMADTTTTGGAHDQDGAEETDVVGACPVCGGDLIDLGPGGGEPYCFGCDDLNAQREADAVAAMRGKPEGATFYTHTWPREE